MPTYDHFQKAKSASDLPHPKQIGVCLTCSHWQVEQSRTHAVIPLLALCVQPDLKPYALIVSGSSACNKWLLKAGVEASARAYAEEGEKAA